MSSARIFSGAFADQRRSCFLHKCFLCKKPIAGNCDIFMYRGDEPFCSEECRQEQIAMDEALEVGRTLSRATVPVNHSSSSSTKRTATAVFSSQTHFEAGTAVFAG